MESNNERRRGFLSQDVRKEIAKLDASSPSDRKAVLKTIVSLVETYIIPNMDLAIVGPDGTYFDLDVVAGCEVSGLLLDALFAPRFRDLHKPFDAALEDAPRAVDLDLPDADSRAAFFRCWAARKASTATKLLLTFLRSNIPTSPRIVESESDDLACLLAQPLPGDLMFDMGYTIRVLSPEQAHRLWERATNPLMVEALQ